MVISVLVRDRHANFGNYSSKSLERSETQNYLGLPYWKDKSIYFFSFLKISSAIFE